MAGEKLFIADKSTLDLVKATSDNILAQSSNIIAGINTANNNILVVSGKADNIRSDLSTIYSYVLGMRADTQSLRSFTVQSISKSKFGIIQTKSSPSGYNTYNIDLSIDTPGTLHYVLLNYTGGSNSVSNTSALRVTVDGVVIYDRIYTLGSTANFYTVGYFSNEVLSDYIPTADSNISADARLFNSLKVHTSEGINIISANNAGIANIVSLKSIKFNTLRIESHSNTVNTNNGRSSVSYYYELD